MALAALALVIFGAYDSYPYLNAPFKKKEKKTCDGWLFITEFNPFKLA